MLYLWKQTPHKFAWTEPPSETILSSSEAFYFISNKIWAVYPVLAAQGLSWREIVMIKWAQIIHVYVSNVTYVQLKCDVVRSALFFISVKKTALVEQSDRSVYSDSFKRCVRKCIYVHIYYYTLLCFACLLTSDSDVWSRSLLWKRKILKTAVDQ